MKAENKCNIMIRTKRVNWAWQDIQYENQILS